MSRTHWADLGETTFVGGTWFLYAVYRLLGRLPFRLCLYPVVFCWWLGSGAARRASLEYLRRLQAAENLFPRRPGMRESLRHFLLFAETLLDTDFHANAFRHLGGRGVLVMNLAGTRESFAPHVARLLEVFDERVIAMPVREDGNHILLAFRDPVFAPRWSWMRSQALALQARTGLDFPNLAGALEAGERQGHAWRLAR